MEPSASRRRSHLRGVGVGRRLGAVSLATALSRHVPAPLSLPRDRERRDSPRRRGATPPSASRDGTSGLRGLLRRDSRARRALAPRAGAPADETIRRDDDAATTSSTRSERGGLQALVRSALAELPLEFHARSKHVAIVVRTAARRGCVRALPGRPPSRGLLPRSHRDSATRCCATSGMTPPVKERSASTGSPSSHHSGGTSTAGGPVVDTAAGRRAGTTRAGCPLPRWRETSTVVASWRSSAACAPAAMVHRTAAAEID